MSTQPLPEYLLIDTTGGRLLVTNGTNDLLLVDIAQVAWPYSPPVWNTFQDVNKRPWNPRKHYRGWK